MLTDVVVALTPFQFVIALQDEMLRREETLHQCSFSLPGQANEHDNGRETKDLRSSLKSVVQPMAQALGYQTSRFLCSQTKTPPEAELMGHQEACEVDASNVDASRWVSRYQH
eukprot:TRINITY_DN4147_c0_g1_i5.p1 TRINITY_DN4147_c0_g1~~TRINITY_DN4147_c0_g1_i5.p1  ORF type:complete len:113 (+),score=14.90 TRINITY_DN4147_c0_g1_i5:715-1053(+)